jgi:DNA-directed RNA polymerase specialized sigma24 family protein
MAMIEFAAPPAGATAAPTVGHDRLDHVISGVAAGDRAAFRRLYAFMAMRVWHIVTEARLCPADAVAVARSTFVEVWHSARAATHYDARDWMATVTTGHVNDRLRIIDANGRHGVHPAEPGVGADRQNQPPTVVDYDAHVHRELTALLGAGGATIRTSSGVFARIDDLDHALATIAAATRAAATGPC